MNKPAIPDSSRLRYRLMDLRDKEFWFELDQDAEAMRFLNAGEPTPREHFENFVAPRFVSFTNAAEGHGLWELASVDSGEALGWILVRHYRFDRPEREADNIELGWRLKREHWGQGFATEAARAIMNVLQRNPAIRAFSAMADPANLASIGVMKKLGMRFVDERMHIVGDHRYPSAYYEVASPSYSPLNYSPVNYSPPA